MQALMYGGPEHGRVILVPDQFDQCPASIPVLDTNWRETGGTVEYKRRLYVFGFVDLYTVYYTGITAPPDHEVRQKLIEKGVLRRASLGSHHG